MCADIMDVAVLINGFHLLTFMKVVVTEEHSDSLLPPPALLQHNIH